jgi:hypothetical protein
VTVSLDDVTDDGLSGVDIGVTGASEFLASEVMG